MPLLTSDSRSGFKWVVYFGVRDWTMINSMADRTANSLEGRRNYGFGWVWRRLLAGVVDWLVLIGWVFVAVMVVAVATAIAGLFNEYLLLFLGFPVTCVVVILRHVLVVFRVSSNGDTLGHRLFGLRIVDSNGEIIGPGRALGRQILGSPLLSAYVFPIFVLYLIGTSFNAHLIGTMAKYWVLWGLIVSVVLAIANHVWMAMDDRGRGWHDWLAGTVVVTDDLVNAQRS